ncbi:MAG: TIGR04283 family arsenosugar biosynthesis glycosyltransferase [Rhodospirillales bacterium]|nr:TIGR04283 family arsenosugar biosynthesis glycosyltransferase [Rhodospirillales bacterium]
MLSKDRPTLSIIIPTLNEGYNIGSTIDALKKDGIRCRYDIVVVDGGSEDQTVDEARLRGAQIVKSEPGRGKQLAAGGLRARGYWFLFLHADTELSSGWFEEAERFMNDDANYRHAAVFSFLLDDDTPAANVLEAIVNWRTKILALPYGDQGLLMSRSLYHDLHGYAPFAIMEDVEIIRRIGRDRLHVFKAKAITSADKYRRDGYFFRPMKNLFCLCLYFLGVPTRLISKIYR